MNEQITIDCIEDLLADYSLYFEALCQEDVKQNVINSWRKPTDLPVGVVSKVIEDSSKLSKEK